MGEKISIKLKNNNSEISRLSERIESLAEAHSLSPKIVYELNLILEELITNIIKYGYDDEKEHEIAVSITLEKDRVSGVVEDDGHYFNPHKAESPDIDKPVEQKSVGKLGIHLVKNLTDKFKYERRQGRNIISFEKNMY